MRQNTAPGDHVPARPAKVHADRDTTCIARPSHDYDRWTKYLPAFLLHNVCIQQLKVPAREGSSSKNKLSETCLPFLCTETVKGGFSRKPHLF